MNKSIDFLRSKIEKTPEIGIVLGSGLGSFADSLQEIIEIDYSEIPGFPLSTVEGHSGKLIFGVLQGKYIVCMKGRIHFYEGMPMKDVVYPIKILCSLGINNLIITNAAGGVNTDFKPGDLMLIRDHINFAGINPLIGPNDVKDGPRFPDMTYTYNKDLYNLALSIGDKQQADLKEGVYMYFTGPSYETPAEIKMAQILGADAVGMSTVPEAIVAHHRGVKILGISCISNMAAGIMDQALDHQEVIDISKKVELKFRKFLSACIGEM